MRKHWMTGALLAGMVTLAGCGHMGMAGNGYGPGYAGGHRHGMGMMAGQGGCPMMEAGKGACMQGGMMMPGCEGMAQGCPMMEAGRGPGMMGRPGMGMGPGMQGGMMQGYAGLDLTDEQRAKIGAIRQGVREQMVAAREEARKQIEAVLTPEQREKLRTQRQAAR